jgi:hypothetical protein
MTMAASLNLDDFPEAPTARPVWLVTLADLGLLLIGFFVLLQAHRGKDDAMLAKALRHSFGGASQTELTAPALTPEAPMPLAVAMVDGFAAGNTTPPAASLAATIAWARDISRDSRTMLVVTGAVDGSAADVDPATGSGALLAVDRARTVAAAIARAVPGARLAIDATDANLQHQRGVRVSLGFAGNRQDPAAAAATAKLVSTPPSIK